MGTRGIMGVRINGQDKLTYNHWDSYPSGLGAEIVKVIRSYPNLEPLKSHIYALQLVNEDESPTPLQITKFGKFLNTQVGEKGPITWYQLLRETQGDLEKTFEAGFMIDSHEFIKDSLFCEWAYIINADEDTFEVYRGFQTKLEEQKGRYALTEKPPFEKKYEGQEQYLSCTLVATYPLSAIPEDWVKQVEGADEDEDPTPDGGGEPVPEPPTCILTGADGENPDDCTTHKHEEDEPVAEPEPAPKPEPKTTSSTFTVDAKEFRAALELAVCEKKATIPVLSHVCLVPDGKTLRVLSSDLDLWRVTEVAAKIKAGAGKVVLPWKRTLDLLKGETGALKITAQIVTLEEKFLHGTAKLDVGGVEYEIATLNPANFPQVPEIEKTQFTVPGEDLKTILGRVKGCISTEQSRYVLQGANFVAGNGKLTIVATDGHRLALDAITVKGIPEVKALVPRDAVLWVHKYGKGDVNISFGESNVFFTLPDARTTLISRKLTGQFPNYEAVIPAAKDRLHTATFPAADAVAKTLVKVAQCADERSRCVKVLINGAVTLSASSTDNGKASAKVTATVKHPQSVPEIVIGFNSSYVLDVLKIAGKEPVVLSLKDQGSAGVFTIPSLPEYVNILMPMRL